MSQTEEAPRGSRESGPAIKLEHITKTFNNGDVVAVDDANLEIGPEEFVVLLGPSGCGKTTTLRSIAGLEQPDEGSIHLHGEDITDLKPKDRNLAFVFQSIALFPHKTVRENIRFGLDMTSDLDKEEKNRRVEETAETLGIEEMLDRKPSALSGGQQQRVSLGRAMIMDPAAFLLDEPFSALDAHLRDQMELEIQRLQRELETPMVFVTHDQSEAMTLADKIVVMNDGDIQQIGTPYEIYNDPQNIFISTFIGSPEANILNCDLVQRGDELELDHDLFTLTLPSDKEQELPPELPDTVSLVIRPDYMRLGVDEADKLFTATISVLEPQGSTDNVFLDADGHEIRAVTDQHAFTSEGRSVPVSFDREKVWLFDEHGERLL
ncbi:ABC transporter ATP-binding protein [Halorussus sp. AFM4]|uniref:ABC transporter ATP-binding protein n=1 Tax=Halorussus sp. AFM4 TaxID=3421651 RepID=UPI003EBC343A